MAQDYDKIIKENFRNSIPFLLRVILGISNQPDQMEKIDLKLQYTLEREPDFLKKVKTENPENDYAIQVEFQSDSPPNYDMIARFLVYKGLILRIEKLPNKQFVFYVGNENPTMKNHYEDDNIKFHFIIVDFKDIDYELFLNSNKPEEVIFAILADFKKKNPKAVIEDILKKLQQLIKGKMKLQKFVNQLEVISKLRNLQPLTIKSISNYRFKKRLI